MYRPASPTPFTHRIVVNVVLYQIVWLACALSAAAGMPELGTLTALAVILWHLAEVVRPLKAAGLIVLTGLLGGIWDSLLVNLNLIHYPSGMIFTWMAPYWIIALWMAFATTFNLAFHWLHGRLLLAALFGAVGGPLAWWAGARLGALELVNPIPALTALSLGWMVMMPLLMKLAARFDGVSEPS